MSNPSLFELEQDKNPRRCSICKETFSEDWMAKRCEAQGRPAQEYRSFDVVANKAGVLSVCIRVMVHHAFGVQCHVEGPCPHDITYYGYVLHPTIFGPERAFMAEPNMGRELRPGWDRVTTLTDNWGIIPESGPAELYLINVSPLEEWEALWSYYPAKTGRRGGRRLIKEEGNTNAQHDEARVPNS